MHAVKLFIDDEDDLVFTKVWALREKQQMERVDLGEVAGCFLDM
jgi:hypothetical protein